MTKPVLLVGNRRQRWTKRKKSHTLMLLLLLFVAVLGWGGITLDTHQYYLSILLSPQPQPQESNKERIPKGSSPWMTNKSHSDDDDGDKHISSAGNRSPVVSEGDTCDHTACPTQTPTREVRNEIIYGSVQAAGLLDRSQVLRGLLELSVGLSGDKGGGGDDDDGDNHHHHHHHQRADVIVPKPAILLDSKHNQDKTVSTQMTWDDFFSFYRHDNNKEMMEDDQRRTPHRLSLLDIQTIYPNSISTQGRNRHYVFHPSAILEYYRRPTNLLQNRSMMETHDEDAVLPAPCVRVLTTTRPEQAITHYQTIWNWTVLSNKKNKNLDCSGSNMPRWIWIWTVPYEAMRRALFEEFPSLLPLPPKLQTQASTGEHPTGIEERISRVKEEKDPQTTTTTTMKTPNNPPSLVVTEKAPTYVHQIVDHIWNDHILNSLLHPSVLPITSQDENNWVFGYLHIRRGDSKGRCNTTLAKMESYLSCSLTGLFHSNDHGEDDDPGSNLNNTIRLVLLFSSDETEPTYRQGIRRIMEHYQTFITPQRPDHSGATISSTVENYQMVHSTSRDTTSKHDIRFFDLDALIRTVISSSQRGDASSHIGKGHQHPLPQPQKWWTDNNYLVFRIQLELQRPPYSSFLLEQRQRYHCSDCDLVQLLK